MNDSTVKILDVTLRADSSVTPAERNRILKVIRGEPMPAPPDGNGNRQPRIFSRAECAKLLGGKSARFIDLLCRKNLLKKFIAPGCQRSIGVTSASLEKFLEGGGN